MGDVLDGDQIIVTPGPYSVGGALLTASDSITIRPRDAGTRPVISATGAEVLRLEDDATVRDLAINTTTGTGAAGALTIHPGGDLALVERVTVHSTLTGGMFGLACNLFDGTLRDSVCRMTNAGGSFAFAAGSVIGGPANTYTPRFVNVTAYATGGSVTPLTAQSNGANVVVALTAHNVIAAGVTAGTLGLSGSAASATLTNSNFQGSAPIGTGASVTPAGSPTNQTAVPVFVNAAGGDFRQATGSPTIDAGAPDAAVGTLDLDFGLRAQGADPDIGADEFPGQPSIISTDPASPADDSTPQVQGTAPTGSTVKVYAGATCTGSPLATGTAAQFAGAGIGVTVSESSTTQLRATVTDPGGGPESACSAPLAYTESAPGGGGGPADTKAPTVTITSRPKPKVKTKKKTAPFSVDFTADEASSFSCSLDDTTPAACTSPFTGKAKKGPHTVSVTATDAAGNRSAPVEAAWTVKRKQKKRVR